MKENNRKLTESILQGQTLWKEKYADYATHSSTRECIPDLHSGLPSPESAKLSNTDMVHGQDIKRPL